MRAGRSRRSAGPRNPGIAISRPSGSRSGTEIDARPGSDSPVGLGPAAFARASQFGEEIGAAGEGSRRVTAGVFALDPCGHGAVVEFGEDELAGGRRVWDDVASDRVGESEEARPVGLGADRDAGG